MSEQMNTRIARFPKPRSHVLYKVAAHAGFRSARRLRAHVVVVVALLLVAGLGPVHPAAAASPSFTTLQPGKPAHLSERLPVQIVLVGYDPQDVPEDVLRTYLPSAVKPIDRNRLIRTGAIDEMGLAYDLDYQVRFADRNYEDAFFGFLAQTGVPERRMTGYDISFYQYLYNLQPGRSLDITNNLVIDAPTVERWLVEHPFAGIDSNRDTLVLVNWWGRSDFRFHDYSVTGDPQSETGVDFGKAYWTRVIAWGGTQVHDEETGFGRPSRTWFHDLSAGPDWRSAGWVIDDTFGGYGPDPATNAIFPPSWEYLTGHATDRWPLPNALGVIARYVAVNTLFAPSPIYGHEVDAVMSADTELDVTVQSELSGPVFTPSLLQQEIGELLGAPPRVDVDQRPLAGTMAKCLYDFSALQRCRPELDPAVYTEDADLYLGAQKTQPQWRDGSAESEVPGFILATPDTQTKWFGVAADDYTDGSRAAAFNLPNQRLMKAGYGPTSSLIHEYGHLFGLSHSHDGYEGTRWQGNYGASGGRDFYFAWVGDEVSSVMTYTYLNNDFSQFDLDNYQRWQTARYLRAANLIAADVLASKKASAGTADLVRADAAFAAAQRALTAHDYVGAETSARDGYALVRNAATSTATPVTKSTVAWDLTQPGKWHGKGAANGAPMPAVDGADALAVSTPPPSSLLRSYAQTRSPES